MGDKGRKQQTRERWGRGREGRQPLVDGARKGELKGEEGEAVIAIVMPGRWRGRMRG